VPDQVVNVILELGSTELKFIDFLVGGEIDFLLDAIDGVVQSMVLIEHFPKVIIRTLQPPNDLAMFRKLSQDWVMQIHGCSF